MLRPTSRINTLHGTAWMDISNLGESSQANWTRVKLRIALVAEAARQKAGARQDTSPSRPAVQSSITFTFHHLFVTSLGEQCYGRRVNPKRSLFIQFATKPRAFFRPSSESDTSPVDCCANPGEGAKLHQHARRQQQHNTPYSCI